VKEANDLVFFGGADVNEENSFNTDFLSVFCREFMFLCHFDGEKDSCSVKIINGEALGLSAGEEKNFSDFGQFLSRVLKYIHPEDAESVGRIFTPEGYREVLENSNFETFNVRWNYGEMGYLYNQLVVAAAGDSRSAVIIGMKEIGKEHRERIIRENINMKYASAILSLSREYPHVYIVDLESNDMSVCADIDPSSGLFAQYEHGIDYDETIASYIRDVVYPDQQEHMLLVLSREYVKWSLRENNAYTREFLNKEEQYCEITYLQPNPESDSNMVIMGLGVKDEEIRAKIEDARQREFQQSLMEGLSKEYHTVFLIHPDRTMELYRTTGVSTIMEALRIGMEVKDYSICLPLYVRRYVAADDQDRILEEATFYNLIKNVPENGILPITYKRVDSTGEETYHQTCFAKAKGLDGETNIVMAFRDVDATIRQQIREREQYNSVVKERDSDGLTSMNNRLCYERRIKEYPEFEAGSISVIYVDVDGLHELNNTKGHEAGDIMLKFVAYLIQEKWGIDHTYRIGGDEFTAFLFDVAEEDLLKEMEAFRARITEEGYRVSMGECTAPLAGIDMTEVIKKAEERMYAEKRSHYSGKNDRRRR